jgi:hypothetical protein
MRDGLGVAILRVGSGALFDEIFSSLGRDCVVARVASEHN